MKEKEEPKNISHYNTFEVFEDIYGQPGGQQSSGEFEIPVEAPPSRISNWLLGIVIVIVLALGVHPLLSYSLKTPYPLIVVAENSMQPSLVDGDLVITTGVINPSQIKVGDIVAYRSSVEPVAISIQRVIAINGSTISLQGDAKQSPAIDISANQIVSKVFGDTEQHPIFVPYIGKLSTFLARL